MTRLSRLPVLLLDAQATAASPLRGALLEIGWALQAAEAPHLAATDVASHLVAAPPGALLPPAVARITGLTSVEWEHGLPPEQVWQRLLLAASAAPLGLPLPTVVHFARFEEPFLRALHERHGHGDFPLRLLCTHAIARRLLPELPRRTLRALAGYFGAGVPPLRRSADHVAATCFVWRHLVALLEEREGLTSLDDLEPWLARPAPRGERRWPLARERRLQLPDRPGVYRLLRAGGAVIYVGKAASIRQRVGGHFHGGAGLGERALDMLTQARDVSWSETATPLEAALLEADEIKRLAPPFNVALTARERGVWFASPDLSRLRAGADAIHVVGPLVSQATIEALDALRAVLADSHPASLAVRARAIGVEARFAPDPACFADGLALFIAAHGPGRSPRALLRLGARLWERRLRDAELPAHGADPPEGQPAAPPDEPPRRPAWDPEGVRRAIEETVVRAAHAVRRARWLCRLSECSLAWAEAGAASPRLLVLAQGRVVERGHLEPAAPLPIPPGHARTLPERRAVFDLATFDRLRVLTTELRALAAGDGPLELRLGRHARLFRPRLRAVLRWV